MHDLGRAGATHRVLLQNRKYLAQDFVGSSVEFLYKYRLAVHLVTFKITPLLILVCFFVPIKVLHFEKNKQTKNPT